MILSIQLSTAGHPRTPRQTAKSVVKGVLQTVITVAAGLVELMKTLPSTLKINMAPKAARYSTDKAEGRKTTRTGKDKGDSVGEVRRPISTAAKLSGKNTTSIVKDSQNDDGITSPMASQSDILDSGVVTKKKRNGSPIRRIGHSAQRSEIPAERGAAGDMDDTTTTTTTLGTEGWQHVSSKSMAGDKEIEKSLKPPDWAKDGGDEFYSLTEESDITSSEHNPNETGSSISSEMGDISSSKEPTVRQQQRHRRHTKVRSGPSEGIKSSMFADCKTLKWDYSGIRLTDIPIANGQQMANNNPEGNAGGPASSTCIASGESGMLQSIYNSIKELQTETRIENRRARVATKRLQGTVRKVAKSCIEIEAKLNTIEERTAVVEADVEALRNSV
ncbi:hypothetical protein NDU88_004270 [Pleurodeles waltl]|uniref:Uncharacterized protein n=1 Tax=Pleurodeles waltl TaxID=8319 RepID=A0AAV7LNT7_PLEWA|nr:hypothetical protein NDU88_004270 [Pleurodeles waltl]